MSSYIAFFDLLGIKEYAYYDPKAYFKSMKFMQEELVDVVRSNVDFYKSNSTKVYSFSDCAFVKSSSLAALVKFFRHFRSSMLGNGCYFNGAVTRGDLGAFSTAEVLSPTHNCDEEYMSFCNNLREYSDVIVSSAFLKEDVGRVYHLFSQMKGVGIYFDPKIYEELDGEIVQLFFLPSDRKLAVRSHYDIRLANHEYNEEIFKLLIRNASSSGIKQKKVWQILYFSFCKFHSQFRFFLYVY